MCMITRSKSIKKKNGQVQRELWSIFLRMSFNKEKRMSFDFQRNFPSFELCKRVNSQKNESQTHHSDFAPNRNFLKSFVLLYRAYTKFSLVYKLYESST